MSPTHLMSFGVEELEQRDSLSVAPLVTIIGVGVNAQDFIPMVQVMLGDNTTLLQQAGYNIGHGTINGTINLPGTPNLTQITAAVSNDVATGLIPGGPGSLVLVFSSYEPAGSPANSSAFHTGGPFGGPPVPTTFVWTQAWESVPAFHEFDEALADMAGAGFEICDAVNWQSEFLDGFNISNFVLPNGVTPAFTPQPFVGNPLQITPFFLPQPPVPFQPPTLDQLFALGIERIEADVFGILAQYNPAFGKQATVFAQQEAANPWWNTPYGNVIVAQADNLVLQALMK